MELKERIIEEAARQFKIYGIKAVTMDLLAAQLGISKRTIYEVFSDKDELLVNVLKWMAEKQKALVAKILEDSESAIHAIFRMLETSRDHFQDMSPAFQLDLKKYHYDVLMKLADKIEMPDYRSNVQVLERGIMEGHFRNDISLEIVNRTLYALGRSTMDYDLYPFEEFARRDIIKNVFIIYLKGISTPEGLGLINKLEEKF
jgi:TetR/AcrR family transcriptional regulator, cholesterol catabolism regulator